MTEQSADADPELPELSALSEPEVPEVPVLEDDELARVLEALLLVVDTPISVAGLAAVTDELEHPFRDAVNGLPLDAMCRIIEVSVAEALGEAPPPYLEPIDNVLS